MNKTHLLGEGVLDALLLGDLRGDRLMLLLRLLC